MKVQNAPDASVKRTPLIVSSLLVLMIFSAYSNTFDARPVLDDFHSFIDEPLVRIQNLSTDSIWSLKESKFGWARWIPMTTLSLDLWAGKGQELFNLHLTNLIIHLLNFLSVTFLVLALCKASRGTIDTEREWSTARYMPLWVAGIWALHPLQTNAVTYIVQRMASLVALFTILSVAFYLWGRLLSRAPNQPKAKSFLCYSASLLSMVMGFFTKENSAMIPFLLVLTEAWFFSPDLFRSVWKFCRKRAVLSTTSFAVISILSLYYLFYQIIPSYAGRHFTLTERLLTESRIVIWYVSLLLWPAPGRLSLEHDVFLSTSLVHPPTTLLAVLTLCVGIGMVFVYRRKQPLITYGVLWFFLNLVIESTVIPLELVFEHRMYLPSIGLLLSLTVLVHQFAQQGLSRIPARDFALCTWCSFAILASTLCLSTFYRNDTWRDPLTLARDNALKAPNNPRARANLAVALGRHGLHEDSIREAEQAIRLGVENYEQHAVALNTMVQAYSAMGQHRKALEVAEQVMEEKGDRINSGAFPKLLMNMALAEDSLLNPQGAFRNAQKALLVYYRIPGHSSDLREAVIRYMDALLTRADEERIDLDGDGVPDPGDLSKEVWVAKQILAFGDRATAQRLLRKALAQNDHDAAGKELLEALVEEANLNEKQAEKNLRHYTANPYSRFNASMAIAFLIQKREHLKPLSFIGETFLEYALKLNPDSADAHLMKAWYHHDQKHTEEAILEARRAVELDPEYARAWLGLGMFFASVHRYEEAITAFTRTLDLYPGFPQRTAVVDLIAQARESVQSKAGGGSIRLN